MSCSWCYKNGVAYVTVKKCPLGTAKMFRLAPCTNPRPKWHLDRFSRFCTAHARDYLFRFFPFLSTISSFFPLSMPFYRFLPHFRDIGATAAEKLEGTSCGLGDDPLLFPPVFLPPLLTLFHVAPFQPFLPYTFPLKSTQGVCINAISSIPTLSWRSLTLMVFCNGWLKLCHAVDDVHLPSVIER